MKARSWSDILFSIGSGPGARGPCAWSGPLARTRAVVVGGGGGRRRGRAGGGGRPGRVGGPAGPVRSRAGVARAAGGAEVRPGRSRGGAPTRALAIAEPRRILEQPRIDRRELGRVAD